MTDAVDLDRETVKSAVVSAIRDTMRRDLPELTETTRLFDDLALGSTGVLVVLASLENSLGLSVDPETITEEHLATLGGLVDCAFAARPV